MQRELLRLRLYLGFVKFEHTAFALPLIVAGAMLAAGGMPGLGTLSLIIAAAAGARACAMAFNRLADRLYDAQNPRTAGRELPSGLMSVGEGWMVLAAGACIYVAAAAALGRLCLFLSPVPLFVFAAYPYLKRFTCLSHLGVGIADALGPLGAWVAVRCSLGAPVLEDSLPLAYLAGFTVLWVSGFDIIYATLDGDFDRSAGLKSLPALLGRQDALSVSGAMHFLAGALLAFLYMLEFAGPFPLFILAAIAGMLLYEHQRTDDVHFAFFTANAIIGALVLALVATGLLIPPPT
jgi:4-hydroxybenzoate polyprenyltransferase